ncbi:uncharacterized protein LAJ45_10263 [Morchella importuna]|uniref:uncharacterized protein n=1 Tax=Morchella importuna TaxID=1174673 RepID=UPI001E8E0226|nr:uncharacterized protein LAJ45_10263 [Morchella importuna]KAH8145786.1 hypothetical protein LAJ45_10263 [Morchella importuna]
MSARAVVHTDERYRDYHFLDPGLVPLARSRALTESKHIQHSAAARLNTCTAQQPSAEATTTLIHLFAYQEKPLWKAPPSPNKTLALPAAREPWLPSWTLHTLKNTAVLQPNRLHHSFHIVHPPDSNTPSYPSFTLSGKGS